MDISKITQVLPALLKCDIAPNLVGEKGIGKTSVLMQYAKDNGHKIFTLNLGNQDVGDIIGLADFQLNNSGEKIATKFMMPTWALELMEFAKANPDKYAIVFLDEINRASRRDVLQAIFPLILEKRLHTTQLPKNIRIVGAMNPDSDSDFVTDLGTALISRFCFIKTTASVNSFVDYAKTENASFEVTSFIQDQPELFQKKTEFSIPEKHGDSRAWMMVSTLLKEELPRDLFQELLYGIVGQITAIAFMKHLAHGEKPLSAREVLDVFDKSMQGRIKKYVEDENNRRLDILKYTVDALVTELHSVEGLTEKQGKNLLKFLLMIPKDMVYDFCRKTTIKDRKPVQWVWDLYGSSAELSEIIKSTRGLVAV